MGDVVGAAWAAAEAVGAQLAGVSLALLVAGLVLHILKSAARARAWQNVLRASLPGRRVTYRDAAVPHLAGVGAGAVVPGGGGTVLRIALARAQLRPRRSADGDAPTATIVGTVAPERVLDGVVTALVVAAALILGVLPNGVLHRSSARLGLIFAHPFAASLTGIGLVLAAGALWWVLRDRLATAARDVARGLRVFTSPARYVSSVAAWQLLAWGFRLASLVLLLEAFHIPRAATVAPIVLSLQLVAASVPLTPGGAGTQQALVAAALGTGAYVTFSAASQVATMVVDVLMGSAALAVFAFGARSRRRPAEAALPSPVDIEHAGEAVVVRVALGQRDAPV